MYRGKLAVVAEFRAGYLLFFIGLALVGPGSAWYHLAPDNAGLVWDRLPMTLGFMAFFTVIIAEYIAVPAGRALLWPLVLAGLASVLYWKISEARGQGDLRWYGLVQFLPMLLIPLILLLFRPSFTGAAYPWTMLGAYGAAKLAEFLDAPLFQMFHPLSGHTLKHLLAASAAYIFLMGLRGRKPIAAPEADSGSRENSA